MIAFGGRMIRVDYVTIRPPVQPRDGRLTGPRRTVKMAPMIRFHNTLGGRVEDFVPIEPGLVKLYTCGPTVYDFPHIGNWRAYVFEDLLKRFLRLSRPPGPPRDEHHRCRRQDHQGRRRPGGSASTTTPGPTSTPSSRNGDSLNIRPADVYPRPPSTSRRWSASSRRLLDKGFAYRKDGSIYFAIDRFPAYGRLSGINLEDLPAGQPRRLRRVRERKRPRFRPVEGPQGGRAGLADRARATAGPAGTSSARP